MAALTFLFTDIEGSTRLWDAHPEAMRHALAVHDEVVRKEIEANGGTVFKHTGDGALAVFGSAVDALTAAAGIRTRMSQISHPDIGFLRVRMAADTGEAEERDGDYFGPALNRASRLLSLAHGGQVLVSLITERLGAGPLPKLLSLTDLGEHRLRDLARLERVFQLDVEGLDNEFPPLITPDLVPNNLPTQATSFVGREQDLAEVIKLVRGSRLVTITGVGGAGKTRLALQAAAEFGREFEDGSWVIELASITDPALIDAAAADALGVPQVAGRSVRAALLEHLADRAALLILDNCEHLIDEAAAFVDDLLAATREARVIATSRELLGVGGEVAFGLRSLMLPPRTETLQPVELGRYDSVRLFVDRAQAAKPDFRLTPQATAPVTEICLRLDGIPLALELAAALMRTFSPRQIADNLDQRFRLLTGGSRTALPRQQTLSAAIDWSYRLLNEKERHLFERLSVFQGGFTLEAVGEACTDDELDTFEVLGLLPALVDKSLVTAEIDSDRARYRLLETLRQFARDRLDESGRADEFRRRHAVFYRDLAVEAGRHIRGPNEVAWWERIDVELDNLRQSMVWAIESGEPDVALATASGFWRFWWFKARWGEGVAWLERTRTAAGPDAPKHLRAEGLLGQGSLMEATDRHTEAIALLEEAVELMEELDAEGADRALLVQKYPAALINLSVALQVAGRDESEVEALNKRALEVARRLDDAPGIAVAVGNLAESAARAGREDEARRLFAEAIQASNALGSAHRLMEQHHQIGLLEMAMGSTDRARTAFGRSLEHSRQGGLSTLITRNLMMLAVCDFDDGDTQAEERFGELVAEMFQNPDVRNHPSFRQEMVTFRAALAAHDGDLELAARLLGAGLAIEDAGTPLDWVHHGRRQRVRDAVESGLGEAAAAAAIETGRLLSEESVDELIVGSL